MFVKSGGAIGCDFNVAYMQVFGFLFPLLKSGSDGRNAPSYAARTFFFWFCSFGINVDKIHLVMVVR